MKIPPMEPSCSMRTDRQTDTDRRTDGQTDRHRKTDRWTDIHRQTQTDRRTDRHRKTDRQTQTDGQMDRRTETQTDRHTQTDRNTDRQTHTDRQTKLVVASRNFAKSDWKRINAGICVKRDSRTADRLPRWTLSIVSCEWRSSGAGQAVLPTGRVQPSAWQYPAVQSRMF